MTLNEYQELAMRTAGPSANDADSLILSALGLCGESGEFADAIKKNRYHGHPIPIAKLVEELGDILWYVSRATAAMGFDMEWIATRNINKLKARYPEGFSSERSIDRES